MPIIASSVKTLALSALDAEGSDYYTDNEDVIPAINRAQDFVVSIINSNLGAKKFAEENYRELIKCGIFQTSVYSRISVVPSSGEKVWTLLSVVVNPVVAIPPAPPSPYSSVNTIGGVSIARPQYVMVDNDKIPAATRLNVEEANSNSGNPFMPGYTLEPNSKNIRYSYLHHVGYGSNVNVPNEIEIRPHLSQAPVALFYVKVPSDIVTINDSLDFPDQFTDVIVKATLKELAYKQGDHTTVAMLSRNDLEALIKALL